MDYSGVVLKKISSRTLFLFTSLMLVNLFGYFFTDLFSLLSITLTFKDIIKFVFKEPIIPNVTTWLIWLIWRIAAQVHRRAERCCPCAQLYTLVYISDHVIRETRENNLEIVSLFIGFGSKPITKAGKVWYFQELPGTRFVDYV